MKKIMSPISTAAPAAIGAQGGNLSAPRETRTPSSASEHIAS